MKEISILKNVSLLEMRDTDKRLKAALVNIFNALDNDLNIQGYQPSDEVIDAVESLDNVVIEIDTQAEEENQNIQTEEVILIHKKSDQPDEGYRDLSETE